MSTKRALVRGPPCAGDGPAVQGPGDWLLTVAKTTEAAAGAAGEARLRPDMKGLHYLRALLRRPGADRIGADDQATARLLRRTVHTGSVCRYEQDPDVPVNWLL